MEPGDEYINGRVGLQTYIERVLEEKQRSLDVASAEREKAAEALRGEQARAMEQAEREREKAARAMRDGLDRAIREGDERLREHIANQVGQITAALDSAEKLEVQRMDAAKQETEGLRREMRLITAASDKAVLKAEEAQRGVNIGQNEFRGQLKDQAAEQYPRMEAESKFVEMDRRIEDARHEREGQIARIDKRVQELERGESGVRGAKQAISSAQAAAMAVAVLIVAIVTVASNLLTG